MTQPKAIGPSFGAELLTAGIPNGLPFSWSDDGTLSFSEGMAPEYIAAIQAVYAAHDPGNTFAVDKELELAKFRADRRAMFSLIGDMGFIALATNDSATVTALVAFRQGVLDLPAYSTVVAATTLTQLKKAMKDRYKTLTDALPNSVKLMFKELRA